jgi:5'-AMP-activated protein kinase regulatory gamma subunit|tara:strand:+ start:629 stop:2026 length:1398 start_codon:yes stop_codon:yes gene_type:complete
MDWIGSSMNNMQIKRDSEGHLKGGDQGTSAMGVKGVKGGGGQDASRARVLEFLQRHTAYELIPESSKVVVLDTKLPVRRAFHACYEQGITAAPLWDELQQEFVGMLSTGDFIDIVQSLGPSLTAPVADEELDKATINAMREERAAESGVRPGPLVSVRPEDSLHLVSLTLLQGRLAMAPVLSYGPQVPRGATPSATPTQSKEGNLGDARGGAGTMGAGPHAGVPQLLHLTNLAEVLACLVRHFRGVPSALPLFSQPIGALPIGTWTASLGGFRGSQRQPGGGGNPAAGVDGRDPSSQMAAAAAASPVPALLPIKAITPNSTVAEAFRLMPGCGALPVVDEGGRLVDVYARSDVILLAANNTYRRVSLSEFTVGQALQAAAAQSPEAAAAQAAAAQAAAAGMPVPPVVPAAPGPRAHTCTRADTLRAVVEALSLPGVRRLVIVDAQTRAVEGVVSLSDVVSFLLPS